MNLNIAIAAEFDLCEKLTEFLAQWNQDCAVKIVEIYSFNEEQGVRFNHRAVEQLTLDEVNWAEFDYLLFAGDASHAPQIVNAAEAGCVVIDMKGVTAAISGVPVVVPTVNDADLMQIQQRNIVAMPDPQVTQLALSLEPLLQTMPVNSVFATSLLPASYVDGECVSKLAGQTARLLNGIPLDENEQRLAFDVFPESAVKNTQNFALQWRKIFPAVNVIFHSVQAPVFYGLAQKITALSDYELDSEQIKAQWRQQDFICLEDTLITPVINGEKESGEERVQLHISTISAVENGIEFWSVADEQRFNLAFLAVELLKRLNELNI